MTASPGELLFLNIGTYNPAGSSVTIDFSVDLDYYSDIHDPVIQAESLNRFTLAKKVKSLEHEVTLLTAERDGLIKLLHSSPDVH